MSANEGPQSNEDLELSRREPALTDREYQGPLGAIGGLLWPLVAIRGSFGQAPLEHWIQGRTTRPGKHFEFAKYQLPREVLTPFARAPYPIHGWMDS